MKKQEKTVLPATENMPTKQTLSGAADDPALSEPQPTEPVKQLSQKDRLERVEAALVQADKNFQDMNDYLKRLEPLVQFSDRLAQEQNQPQPAAVPSMPGGVDPGSLGQLLQMFMGGGGGNQDAEMIELGKQALQSQIGMSKAITDAVVAKITGKAVNEVAEKLVNP